MRSLPALTVLLWAGLAGPASADVCADAAEPAARCRDGCAAACGEWRKLRPSDPVAPLRQGLLPARPEVELRADCKKSGGESCVLLGQLLEARSDIAGAMSRYGQACRGKSPRGCTQLSRLRLMQSDLSRGTAALAGSCEGGDGGNCYVLGRATLDGVVVQTRKPGELLAKACTSGVVAACGDLALLYESGDAGVAVDPLAAADLYALACERGDAESCVRSAAILDAGVWVPRDAAASVAARARACSLGYKAIYPDPDPCRK